MRTRYKAWAVSLINEAPSVVTKEDGFEDDYFNHSYLAIEIGSGKGDFITSMASKYPARHYLAVEKVPTIAGILTKKVIEKELENVRVAAMDAEVVLAHFKDNSIDAIYLNFPDPWPKKRHEKRRLFAERFLNEYYRVLKKDGHLIFQTDNVGLFEYAKETLENSKLEKLDEQKLWKDDDVQSEYEKRFRKLNVKINRLLYKK